MNPNQPKRGQPPIDGVRADRHIHLKLTKARKDSYMAAAKPGKLTEWCFRHLDAAAGYEPTKKE